VQVHVAEYPDRTFDGKVLRISGAFEPTTRTMLTEVVVPNDDGALFPGIHVDVQLALANANPPIVVPATAVITRSEGLQVAIVNEADAIKLNTGGGATLAEQSDRHWAERRRSHRNQSTDVGGWY
jgi:multidrug efflux pump subunit AcrA (membrane-fusion protein)